MWQFSRLFSPPVIFIKNKIFYLAVGKSKLCSSKSFRISVFKKINISHTCVRGCVCMKQKRRQRTGYKLRPTEKYRIWVTHICQKSNTKIQWPPNSIYPIKSMAKHNHSQISKYWRRWGGLEGGGRGLGLGWEIFKVARENNALLTWEKTF